MIANETAGRGLLRGAAPRWSAADTLAAFAVLTTAILARLVFWNGPLGSDDVTYLSRASEIADGVWSPSNWTGASRYGFNVPAGLFIRLFGVNDVSVNLWPLLCSLGEILAVFVLALKFWSRRAALFASLVLACMPLHIASATRIHPDPVVSFFLTLSFILFCFAESKRSAPFYWLTGLAMGAVFWTKELAFVALLSFAAYPVLARRLDVRWLHVIGGGLLMLGAHLLLMAAITGDPFHIFKLVFAGASRGLGWEGGQEAAGYYFRYLFIDIKHTWLAPFLAAAALVVLLRCRMVDGRLEPASAYVAFWLIALVCVLSFFPASLSPLRFVNKQSNYITLFLAPIALLAGWFMTRLPRPVGNGVMVVLAGGGLLLGAMEQQDYAVFTSNGKAAVQFAKTHPNSVIYGTVNNANIAASLSIMDDDAALARRFKSFAEAPRLGEPTLPIEAIAEEAFAVLDQETMYWGGAKAVKLTVAPSCWKELGPLVPTGFGIGRFVPIAMLHALRSIPGNAGDKIARPLQALVEPKPAIVYSIDPSDIWCEKAR